MSASRTLITAAIIAAGCAACSCAPSPPTPAPPPICWDERGVEHYLGGNGYIGCRDGGGTFEAPAMTDVPDEGFGDCTDPSAFDFCREAGA